MWLSAGRPAAVSTTGDGPGSSRIRRPRPVRRAPAGPRGGATAAPASGGDARSPAYQDIDAGKKHQAAFDMCWRDDARQLVRRAS